MTGQLSDNEFENLINEGDLSLDGTDEPAAAPAPQPQAPRQDLSFFGKIPVSSPLGMNDLISDPGPRLSRNRLPRCTSHCVEALPVPLLVVVSYVYIFLLKICFRWIL